MPFPLTLQNVILCFKELIIDWINQILYYNDVYPKEVFTKMKSFDTIVFISRNPMLNSYIENLTNEFLKLLFIGRDGSGGGKLRQLIIIVYRTDTNEAVKRYVLRCDEMIGMGSYITEDKFDDVANGTQGSDQYDIPVNIAGFDWKDIYAQFRSFLFNLMKTWKPAPSCSSSSNLDLFFKVIIDVNNELDLTIDKKKPSNWVKIPPKPENSTPENEVFRNIGEVSAGFLCFSCHLEEKRSNEENIEVL